MFWQQANYDNIIHRARTSVYVCTHKRIFSVIEVYAHTNVYIGNYVNYITDRMAWSSTHLVEKEIVLTGVKFICHTSDNTHYHKLE